MKNDIAQYSEFIKCIKELIYKHQYEAMKQVNTGLLQLYWEIGEEICLRQREQGWGKSVVEILSKEFQKEFPGDTGYSISNLWRMRSFYQEYSPQLNLPPVVGEMQTVNLVPVAREIKSVPIPPLLKEISWTKHYTIIEKCKDPLEREFYIRITKKYGWSKAVLINNIENDVYEKYLTNQTNFEKTVPEKYKHQAKLPFGLHQKEKYYHRYGYST